MDLDPRKSALSILNQLDAGNQTLDQILDSVFGHYPDASRRDKALLFAIVYGVLRWQGRIDWVVSHYSKIKIHKIDPQVLNILRIGLFQVMYLDKIPVSAAVNTSVDLAKEATAPWVVRYVNGVLRSASKGYQSVSLPNRRKHPVTSIAVSYSFPEWLIRRWIERFGTDETEMLCHAFNEIPAITLRTNTLKIDRKKLLEDLTDTCDSIRTTGYSPDGISITHPQTPIDEMEAFKNGFFAVQDEAAQAVTHLLNPKPGETILDACCGLGGKTGHIGQLMKNIGSIIAIDKNRKKLSALEEDMCRLGVKIIAPQSHDLLSISPEQSLPVFDKILLDAPCSGLGVIKRNPDTKWRSIPDEFKSLNKTQAALLAQCAKIVKSGGSIVYVVCSMEPEENEDVIHFFLSRHEDFFIEKPNTLWPAWIKDLVDADGFLRTFPHRHPMDGFFAVRLKKRP